MVISILDQYGEVMPTLQASISEQHHNGETDLDHVEQVVKACESLCLEFNVQYDDKDVIVAAAILHDISKCLFTTKERIPEQFQRLYPTGVNRSKEAWLYHPTLSAFIIGKYIIDTKELNPLLFDVAKTVQSHMSHWLQKWNTKPESLAQYILCMADYTVTRKGGKLA